MDLSKIVSIRETNDIGDVNRALSEGWVLLSNPNPVRQTRDDPEAVFWYCVGLPADVVVDI